MVMGFFRKIAGFLGLANDNDDQAPSTTPFRMVETGLPRKGFGVPVQVAVDRPHLPPVLAPSSSADGGVQGLGWYAKSLRIDEDGDVAHEFFDEVTPETSPPLAVDNHHKTLVKFKLKHGTAPANVKAQVISEGKLKQCVEHQGRLQWLLI